MATYGVVLMSRVQIFLKGRLEHVDFPNLPVITERLDRYTIFGVTCVVYVDRLSYSLYMGSQVNYDMVGRFRLSIRHCVFYVIKCHSDVRVFTVFLYFVTVLCTLVLSPC